MAAVGAASGSMMPVEALLVCMGPSFYCPKLREAFADDLLDLPLMR
jgi:hypothetical protein